MMMTPRRTSKSPHPTRPWIKVLGIALIVAVWMPVVMCAGGMATIALSTYRAEAAAAAAFAAVPIGAPLSDVLLSTSDLIDQRSLLTCYQAVCAYPRDALVVNRAGGFLRVKAGDSAASFDTLEEFRRHLPEVDRVKCAQVHVTFCGRPFMAFFVMLDDRQRVTEIGQQK